MSKPDAVETELRELEERARLDIEHYRETHRAIRPSQTVQRLCAALRKAHEWVGGGYAHDSRDAAILRALRGDK